MSYILNFSLLIIFISAVVLSAADNSSVFVKARNLYYSAIKNEDDLEPAIKLFTEIKSNHKASKGLTETYIGSLVMLKGKYAFWPQQKLKYVEEGIKKMDMGYNLDKKNIESLFIYGSSCYYLPFFLGKGDLAEEKLREIIPLLSESKIKEYEPEVIKGAMEFLLKNIKLSETEEAKVKLMLSKVNV